MTNKRKNRQRNPLIYLWDEFLFSREFEYETPLHPDEVADVLEEHVTGTLRRSTWYRTGIHNELAVKGAGNKARTFTMQSMMTRKAGTSNTVSARADGSIVADRELGLTIVKGKVTFGRVHHAILALGAFCNGLLLSSNIGTADMWDNLICLFIISLCWFQAYSDRNTLAQRLDTAIMTAKHKQPDERLTSLDESAQARNDEFMQLAELDKDKLSL